MRLLRISLVCFVCIYIKQTTSCHGRFYSSESCGDGQWNCNGVCIAEHQDCNQKCNEALGYWMCGNRCMKGKQDERETDGPVCQKKSTHNNVDRSGRNLEFINCSGDYWECGTECIRKWQVCNGVCNAGKGYWKCGSICKNDEERGNWMSDGTNCIEILASSTTIEVTTIEEHASILSIGWIIFLSLCVLLSFSLTCVVLHAIFTCRKYRASEKEENNETPTLIWIIGHIPMYCSGRMQNQIKKEREEEEINNAEIELNEAYGEAYDEEYEENEVVDYNDYYV